MAKQKENNEELFVNPFEAGVNYKIFCEAKGDKTVKEYCEGKLTAEQIEWLENDLTHYKQK
jgi:hypothetical protein